MSETLPTTREAGLMTDVETLQTAHVAGLMAEVAACMGSLGIDVPPDVPVPTVLLEPALTPWIFEYWRPPSATSPAADVILLRPEFRTSDTLVKHGLTHYLLWRATGQVGGHPTPPFDSGCGEF